VTAADERDDDQSESSASETDGPHSLRQM
jgi:hypothetical protein